MTIFGILFGYFDDFAPGLALGQPPLKLDSLESLGYSNEDVETTLVVLSSDYPAIKSYLLDVESRGKLIQDGDICRIVSYVLHEHDKESIRKRNIEKFQRDTAIFHKLRLL
ncbi:hypothetical protein ACJU26_08825 [Acidithiobacillus sp. M4-SHS-6]|uniref:hypothetical protein n=1 Tax=Acidithiobacillus sp. M4-SHS-6 TaxID=3383024 RepID=UPI0039BEB1AA